MEQMDIDELWPRVPYGDALLAARTAVGASAWLVGGCVRDLLLGRKPVDVDLATLQPEMLARHFAGLVDGTVVPMDPARDIWRVALRNHFYFDFCAFRDTDILGDLAGRDFTVNAMALRLPEGNQQGGLLDPFQGLRDLNAGTLRLVAPSALRDDPARILRAFRFLAELHLVPDDATAALLARDADRLSLAAPERVLAEWWKLCAGAFAAPAIERMDAVGALGILFPEVQLMKGVEQNVYHHLDVWQHSQLAMAYMSRYLRHPEDVMQDLQPYFAPLLVDEHRRARLVFLALIHDCGKPATRSVEGGKVHFYQHEMVGAEMAAALCRRLRTSREDQHALTTVIRHHLRPPALARSITHNGITRRSMVKFFDETGGYTLEVLALALADKSAAQGPAADPHVLDHLRDLYRMLFSFYEEQYLPVLAHPLLTGHDLTQALRLPPGPAIGRLLSQARTLQMQGRLTTREQALAWVERQIRQQDG